MDILGVLLSRRRLIFNGNLIHWVKSAVWREHVRLPSHLDRGYPVQFMMDKPLQP